MKSLDLLGTKQQQAVTRIYENDSTYLIGQMGSGKTVVALTAASELLTAREVSRVLVVAPPRVVDDVWVDEHEGWDHLKHLDVGLAVGTPAQRMALIDAGAPIVAISFDNLEWFFDNYGKAHGFDMLVIDEITKMKAGGKSFKALRTRLRDFSVRLVMTGTPVAESWTDLFYCMMACDSGAMFGRNKQQWLDRYFYPTDYERRNWTVLPHCVDELTRKLSSTVFVLPDYTDELPLLHEIVVPITLQATARAQYDEFERDCLNEHATADSAPVLTGKLQQMASGFLYPDDEDADTVFVHDEKIHGAGHLYNQCNIPTIFVYQFKEELARLRARFPKGVGLGDTKKRDAATLALWRRGELPQLFLHPKSAGHGLDLTTGSRMVIMSPIWSRDLTRQTIGRFWRRNQIEECWVFILVAKGTVDEDIVKRENGKGAHMDLLMSRLDRLTKARH